MSELGAGSYGYNDYQRIINYDGPVLLAETSAKAKGPKTFGPVNVSRWLATQIRVGPKEPARNGLLTCEWATEKTGGEPLGERQIPFTSHLGIMQLLVPNLGPWLTVQLEWGGTGVTFVCSASNRLITPAGIVTPTVPVIIPVSTHKLKAAEGVTVYPASYAAGPIGVRLTASGKAASATLEALNPEGEWEAVTVRELAGTLLSESLSLIAPLGAWRLHVVNTAALEAEVTLAAVASPTGAS